MNDSNKIPFGLRNSDQQYVDVADVPNGNRCGCICPSCKTPLQAKQGRIKHWHFAHSSRGISGLTQNECEYSFWVSVLSMAKEIIRTGGILIVPPCTKFLGYDEVFITNRKKVQFFNPEIEKNSFDAYCNFGQYSIGVFFTSPEKKPRESHDSEKSTGILEISLSSALKSFFNTTGSSSYKNILRKIIFENVENKHWRYHPKIEFYNNKYGAKLSNKPPFDIDEIVSGITQVNTGFYQCKHCKIKWRGNPQCPDCHNQSNSAKLDVLKS